jgi:hypothetical protein
MDYGWELKVRLKGRAGAHVVPGHVALAASALTCYMHADRDGVGK